MRTHTWFLVIAVALIGYVILRGGEERFAGQGQSARLNYDTLAVSQGLTPQAAALNLQDDLDVSLLPALGRDAIRNAAQQGLREQAFLQAVLREVSDRVREISTIDLNADGNVDPILVRPEPAEEEQYVLLSLQVPAPESYPLPGAGDAAAWKTVETLEVATMSVSLNAKELAVEARGNQHVYPDSADQRYYAYDRTPSFLQTYVAIRMLDWMFFPSYWGFWGPGWGYGSYRPVPVTAAMGSRTGAIRSRGYERAPSSGASVVRGRSGAAPASRYQRAYSGSPPRSLSQLQASRGFTRRDSGTATRSGGFGRSAGAGGAGGQVTRQAAPTRRYGNVRSASRGFGRSVRGFGRSSRGFGGFGRGMRFRR